MAYQLSEINARIKHDPVGFLEESDLRFQERVAAAADQIIANLPRSPLVLLAGPSGSGKTTTALKLEEELERRGVNAHTISIDNYFLDIDRETAPRTESGEIDYESPKILDTKLLNAHFAALAKGEEVIVPKFEFPRQKRNRDRGRPLRLNRNEIAIFEGIHALNDDIFGRHPEATGIYVSARSNVNEGEELRFKGTWMRLMRRAVRDLNFRGTGISETLGMWENIRRGEKLYISPFRTRANILFDSSLPYEVSVMKNYARSMLAALAEENREHLEVLELLAAFKPFECLDPALVPPKSLLREFIGGGTYQY